jgi:hypothetical protein
LITEDCLKNEDFDLIWSSISKNTARTNQFYKVLKELADMLNTDQILYFIDKVAHKPVYRMTGTDIELLQELAVQSGSSEAAKLNREKVLIIVWRYLFYEVQKDPNDP